MKVHKNLRLQNLSVRFDTGMTIASALAAAMLVGLSASPVLAQNTRGLKWAASWTTAIQSAYVAPATPQEPFIIAYSDQPDLSYALPNATTQGVTNQTMRMIIKPDLWGNAMRLRFSNSFGTQPVTFSAASVALQADQANLVHGTSVGLTFNGRTGVTIQPGQQIFSDPVVLPYVNPLTASLLRGQNLAVSFAVSGASGPASVHSDAFTTSYISAPGSGDVTRAEQDVSFPYSTTSYFFVNELDVLAPKATTVICVLGASIEDGTFSTVNGNDRWPNVLANQLHARYGDQVSVVNEAIAGNTVVYPGVGQPATQRVGRDVIGLSGLDLVVMLEGSNDLAEGATSQALIAGYQNVVAQLHTAKLKVIGSTVTPSLAPGGQPPANSPLLLEAGAAFAGSYASTRLDGIRKQVNDIILAGGLFDATIDLASAVTDPSTGGLYARFVPNSEGSAGDYLHLSRAGYQAMGVEAARALSALAGSQGIVAR